jgi:hypothetical protein
MPNAECRKLNIFGIWHSSFVIDKSAAEDPPLKGHSHQHFAHLVWRADPAFTLALSAACEMVFGRNAVTTIHERSFAGLVVAPFAVALVVCGGFLLPLPIAASPNGAPTMAVVPAPDCAAPADRAGDQQFADNAAGLDAPDSWDDDDDEDDAPTGSDAAIVVDQHRPRVNGDVHLAVHVKIDPWSSRTVERRALRGPPQDGQRSSDADDDLDGDDDDPNAECSDPLPAPTRRATCFLIHAEFVSVSSTRSSGLSLRAPPL